MLLVCYTMTMRSLRRGGGERILGYCKKKQLVGASKKGSEELLTIWYAHHDAMVHSAVGGGNKQ